MHMRYVGTGRRGTASCKWWWEIQKAEVLVVMATAEESARSEVETASAVGAASELLPASAVSVAVTAQVFWAASVVA